VSDREDSTTSTNASGHRKDGSERNPAGWPVGILGAGVGLPSRRLSLSEVAAAWGGSLKGHVAVCEADEDVLTLAFEAAESAVAAAGAHPHDLDGLWWGTSRPPFAEGPSHSLLAASLGLDPASSGTICSGSPLSGMDALLAAWDFLAAGRGTMALVVASDALLPGVGSSLEAAFGAGAAAFVLERASGAPADGGVPNRRPLPALLVASATRYAPVLDRYRPDASPVTVDAYDPRLFREEVFLPIVSGVSRSLLESCLRSGGHEREEGFESPASGPSSSASHPVLLSVADPDGKLAGAAARLAGGELCSAPSRQTLGDLGAASALVGAMEALSAAGSVAMVAYGGGRATGVLIEASSAVHGAREAAERLGRFLQSATPASYTDVLRYRGQLVPTADPVPMGIPPGSAAFVRGGVEMLMLEGARCKHCGTVSTPPSVHPTCIGCGSFDLEVVLLSRSGTVQTFVVNHTMPPPFAAPLPLVVVDLDGGGRVMIQGATTDASRLAIGDRVELRLRRYATERGVPVYGYKAFRSAQEELGQREATSNGPLAEVTPSRA